VSGTKKKLSLQETAAWLKVDTTTVRRWISQADVTAIKVGKRNKVANHDGRCIRIEISDALSLVSGLKVTLDDELLTVGEVAAELGVEASTVRHWIFVGMLPCGKLGKKQLGSVRDNRPIRVARRSLMLVSDVLVLAA